MTSKKEQIRSVRIPLSLHISRGQIFFAGGLFLFLIAGIVVSEWRSSRGWEVPGGTDLASVAKRAAEIKRQYRTARRKAGGHGAGKTIQVQNLNLNTASAKELEALPGIGPALAERIVRYRSQIGRFSRVEQLLEVPGIGKKKLARIRAFLHL